MTTLKRSQLVAVAKELNEQLGLEPAIDTKPGKKNKDLEVLIEEAGQLIDPNEDELAKDTWNVLNVLGVAVGVKTGEETEPEEEPEVAEETVKTEQEEISATDEEKEEAQEESKPESEVAEDKTVKKKGAVKQGKKTPASERRVFMEKLISKGKYTEAEIVEKTMENFPEISKGTATTDLSDGKNPKYNKFQKLIVIDDKRLVSFKGGK